MRVAPAPCRNEAPSGGSRGSSLPVPGPRFALTSGASLALGRVDHVMSAGDVGDARCLSVSLSLCLSVSLLWFLVRVRQVLILGS